MKELLPSLFSLAVLTASAQAPEAMLADITPAPAVPLAPHATEAAAVLELVSFEAYVSGPQEQVFLRWGTASERGEEHFIIERSGDLDEWSPVLELNGEGRPATYTPYEAEDPAPLAGISYYRLRNLENGASAELSDLFSIRRATPQDLLIRPEQTRRFSVMADGALSSVKLMDNRGQFVPMTLDVQQDRVVVDTELLPPGTYYVQAVVDGDPVQRVVIITATGIIAG